MANGYKPIVDYRVLSIMQLVETYADSGRNLQGNSYFGAEVVAKAKTVKVAAKSNLLAAIEALVTENQRLKAELGDLPEAQAEMLRETKRLRALIPEDAKKQLANPTTQVFEFPKDDSDPAWETLAAWVINNLQTRLTAAEVSRSEAYQAGHNAGVAHHKQATLHMRENAGRYRWLRQQHWSTSTIAVVLHPKKNVELGATCPSMEQLDAEIDKLRGVA